MKIKFFLPVLLILFISFILENFFPASNYSTINGKVSGSVSINLRQLVGEEPINISTNKKNAKLNESETKDLKSKVDALLITLHPTQQIGYLPLKDYLKITYHKFDNEYKLYLPLKKSQDPEKSIYLQGQDNGEEVYYRLSGGENETLECINIEIYKK